MNHFLSYGVMPFSPPFSLTSLGFEGLSGVSYTITPNSGAEVGTLVWPSCGYTKRL